MRVPSPRLREIHAARDAVRQSLDPAARTAPVLEARRDLVAAFSELDLGLVGVGSVGMRAADSIARCAPRSLLLVDPALLKQASLATHPCVPEDIGKAKVLVAGERAKAVSPGTRVWVFEGTFEDLPTWALARVSQVLLASDNLRAEASVGQSALQLGFDLLQASLHLGTLTAQLRVFASSSEQGADGACPMCLFGAREWSDLDAGTVFSCEGAAGTSRAAEHAAAATRSIAPLCAMAADLLTLELTRRRLGLADGEGSRLVQYAGHRHRMDVTRLEKNPSCPADHTRMRIEPVCGDLGERTPRELLARSGYGPDADLRRITLAIEGFRYASLVACRCRSHPKLARFLASGESPGCCELCTAEREIHPMHIHDETPAALLAEQLDLTLAALGAAQPTAVRIRGGKGAVLHHATPRGTR